MGETTKKQNDLKESSNIEDYGYYYYPHRNKKGVVEHTQKSIYNQMRDFTKEKTHSKCIWNAHLCAVKSPQVKLLMNALRSKGCDFDYKRHVSCEPCRSRVNGGYDPNANQVVICQNNSTSLNKCCSVLGHEMLHMFDFCRAKADFTNLEHLACTEVRAANFFHCAFTSSMFQGHVTPFNMKEKQKICVKNKALMSILVVRNVSHDEAVRVVDKVFDRCYADLEPFGRHMRNNSKDPEFALAESSMYGYSTDKTNTNAGMNTDQTTET